MLSSSCSVRPSLDPREPTGIIRGKKWPKKRATRRDKPIWLKVSRDGHGQTKFHSGFVSWWIGRAERDGLHSKNRVRNLPFSGLLSELLPGDESICVGGELRL